MSKEISDTVDASISKIKTKANQAYDQIKTTSDRLERKVDNIVNKYVDSRNERSKRNIFKRMLDYICSSVQNIISSISSKFRGLRAKRH